VRGSDAGELVGGGEDGCGEGGLPELWKLDAFTISYRVVIMVINHTSGDGVGLESRKGAGT